MRQPFRGSRSRRPTHRSNCRVDIRTREIEEITVPEFDYEEMKREAEQYIRFEKDKKNRIAYITFDRPDAQNSTIASTSRFIASTSPSAITPAERSRSA